MEELLNKIRARAIIEKEFEYRKWIQEIPFLNFPQSWNVRIIPPFGGAVIRFLVKKVNSPDCVSIYLDCYDELGCMDKPYWEVFPSENGDTARFLMHDTKELLECIEKAINV